MSENMNATVAQLANILREKFKVGQDLADDSRLTDLDLDSLDVINFLFTVEQETGVKIPDEILADDGLESLADFASYIDRNKS
jgi:acyl carrier protein